MSENRSGVLPLVLAVVLFAAGVAAFTWIREPSGPSLRQGSPAPDFSLPDLSGRRHSLSGQRGKKALLIAYASW